MSAPAAKAEQPKTPAPADRSAALQSSARATTSFADNRPATTAHRQQQAQINNSLRLQQAASQQALVAQSLRQQAAQLQALAAPVQRQETPAPVKENKTGLPDKLKAGVESLSGYSLDDVQVHYNSAKPAQLQAHAYAQGTDIHIAPGQEQHLPHEAWHVVQQKQGRVRPTRQLKGKVSVNDDAGLEKEADAMGGKALGFVQQGIRENADDIMLKHKRNKIGIKQLAKKPSVVVQLAEWKTLGDSSEIHYWDELMDGVKWFSNGAVMWYRIQSEGSEDYKELEEQHKTWQEWHALRKGAHPEEYPSIVPEEYAGLHEEAADRPNYAASLLEKYNARYETTVKWQAGSGKEDSSKKIIVIDAAVKKLGGGLEPVYQNSYDVINDTLSADWNQRKTDADVGIKEPAALFNSDLLTCHREMARDFADSQGVRPQDDSHAFNIARHNINNADWQNLIFPELPLRIRGQLSQGIVATRDAPVPFGKTVILGKKEATNMWQVFENLVPNTQAVFRMVQQRYPGFRIMAWTFKSGTATARVEKEA